MISLVALAPPSEEGALVISPLSSAPLGSDAPPPVELEGRLKIKWMVHVHIARGAGGAGGGAFRQEELIVPRIV
jgi:hypothetical protein